ncbi:hypothetical protein HOP50_20g85730 [Chloropicon primus]|nr:hypothetical protein A3770_20p85400 [Chloropicon primus]UPR05223.1 hypothetical protein HOP50_20g85730 [Chloropicon primus]|eukprot:QDZ26022.1 hypothetical protein A3770_20p85400 [Chloropicon primus]
MTSFRSRSSGIVAATSWVLLLGLVMMCVLGGTEAFTMMRPWQRQTSPPRHDDADADVTSSIEMEVEATTLASSFRSSSSLLPLCRGSRDKEPAEYTCKDQVDWGKCNETWLIEGDYCAEMCGRCEERIPVDLSSFSTLSTLSSSSSSSGMPDVGSSSCGGHITYEWRIRTNRAKEASGLAASRLNRHVLWTHVDGWTTKVLGFLSDTIAKEGDHKIGDEFALQGQPVLEVELPHWVNKNPKSGRVDWEDMSTAQCPDGSKRQCLWISDTGNNKFNRGYSQVIAMVEPEITHVRADPGKRISTEYFTPNQVDKRNRAGICQPGMGGDRCQHHKCKSDETNMERVDFEKDVLKTQPEGAESLWVFAFKYPGGKEKDSEALAVAPDGSRFWLFEKNEEVRGANVYESDILFDVVKQPKWNKRYLKLDLFSIAFIQPPCIAAGTDCVSYDEDHLFSITGADVHPEGKSLTLQTYKGPFVYEFEEGRPFDISGMQEITPRPVLTYSNGWGAEAIAYSHNGERLWQMPEENRHDGCQKVLVMDCAQPNLFSRRLDPALEVRSANQSTTLLDNIRKVRQEFSEENAAEGVSQGGMDVVREEVKEVEGILDSIADQIETIAAREPEEPLVCDIIPNGWGTEKNASIPICGGPDRVPVHANASLSFSCEDQAAWGKCEEDWLVSGKYCMGACGRCTHTTCSCPDCKRLKAPELLCNANQVLSSGANTSNVVIFDFDDTLKLHHPARQAPEGLWAVEETVRLGYGIAIATASCHTDYVKKFLGEMAPTIFTPEFLESNAFQSCQKKKTAPLKCNLAHYNLLDKPECAVFFDDSISNEKYADKAGIKMIEVQKGVGVTKDKYRKGIQYMLNECGKPKQPAPEGACDPRYDRSPPGEHTCKEQHRWGKCNETWLIEGDYCAATCGRCGDKGNTTTTAATRARTPHSVRSTLE